MAKSHWHGALRSAHKSSTHTHVSWKRGGVKWKLVAAPWTSGFTRIVVESSQPLGSKRKLVHFFSSLSGLTNFPMWSVVQGACSSLAPCTSVVRVLCQALEPTAFLCTQCFKPLQKMLLLPTSVQQTAHELYRRSRPVPQITIPSFLHLLSVLSFPLLLSKSRASWLIPRAIQRW